MVTHFMFTETSKNITKNLSHKLSYFNDYNASIGVFFSHFYNKQLHTKKWNGKIEFHYNKYLTVLFPQRKTKEILETMTDEKVLKIFRTAEQNVSCNTYKIIEPNFYQDTDIKFARIKDVRLLKKLTEYYDKKYQQLPNEYKILADKLKYFELDFFEANQNLNRLFNETDFFQKKAEEYNSTAIAVYKRYKNQIEAYLYNNNLKTDDVGRSYNKNTTLNNICRKNIMINGDKKTANVDIKTSQPRFLALWLSKLDNHTTEYHKELNKLQQCLSETEPSKDIYSIWDSTKHLPRHKRKTDFFQYVIFRNWNNPNSNPLLNEFSDKFPNIVTEIRKQITNKKANYIPKQMQLLESNFIYKKLIPTIEKYLPHQNYATIHDSIFCKQDIADDIKNTMELCFTDNFKQPLLTSIEKYN